MRALATDLVDTMRAGPATVGLAAPQVGVGVRAFCLDVGSHPRADSSHGLVVLFDPEGTTRVHAMAGFEARAAQHEMDHLDGLLILDRIRSADDLFPRR